MSHITLTATMVARPETRDELLAILLAMVAPSRADRGCLNYHLHVDAKDPCVFMFYENWANQDDLDAHGSMPHLKPIRARAHELLAKPVELKIYKMLSEGVGA
ncbi:MAG: antibiotic biosynthesis monooxygenase [Hyphomicrobiales bacterium]|nr:antibiotic biosynthesis monooxygenase [Hyphomicrobiales bacterium]